jgi:hypothetical protein
MPVTREKTDKAFIVGDSLHNKHRSKKVELPALVHDRNENCYQRGFRLLT